MFNDFKDFNNIIRNIKIKRLEDYDYGEYEYIKEIEFEMARLIFKRRNLKFLFKIKYEVYKTNLNNRKKIEIKKVILASQLYKLIDHIINQKKVDFFNISYIINNSKFIMYSLDNEYIEIKKLEKVRELLEDIEFDKNNKDYNFLINNQKHFKNSLEELLGT